MALRVPPTPNPIHEGSRSTSKIGLRSRCTHFSVSARINTSSFKQNHQKSTSTTFSPPLKGEEALRSLLGLERLLFASAPTPPPPPPPDASKRIRVAYQGARGSYCQEAAAAAFPSASVINPCAAHLEEAFSAIEDGSVDRAVIPLENSLDGPIPRNIDLLLRHPGIRISGELVLAVNHCLISHPSAHPHTLRRIVSHPQALGHCGRRLKQLGMAVEEVPCAAAAARLLAEDAIQDTAVIGSRMAAREYGLSVLEDNVQDRTGTPNLTRFLQLALMRPTKLDTERTASDESDQVHKCVVSFVLEKGPTDMFRAMWAFESRGVKVTRVDHRPNRARPVRIEPDRKHVCMDYVFVVDVEGGRAQVEAAVANLHQFAGSVRMLGRYATSQ